MKIIKAERAVKTDKTTGRELDGYEMVRLQFDDGTKFSIFSEELGFPRIFAHDLLDEYLEGGGKHV